MNPFRAASAALGNLPRFRRLSRNPLPQREFQDSAEGLVLEFVPGWRSGAGVGDPLIQALGPRIGAARAGGPSFDARPVGLEEKAARLRERWGKAPFDRARRLVVVGHSFGGLVAARALIEAPPAIPIDLVTLNSPFGGPRWGLITCGRLLGLALEGRFHDPELAAMRREDPRRAALRRALETAPFRIFSVASRDDEFVPSASARLPGPHLRDPTWVGHTGILVRPDQTESLARALAAAILSPE